MILKDTEIASVIQQLFQIAYNGHLENKVISNLNTSCLRSTLGGICEGRMTELAKTNIKGKKAKVALVAIMHKIVNYIFAVLRNQTPFEQRDSKIHKQMFLENKALNKAD